MAPTTHRTNPVPVVFLWRGCCGNGVVETVLRRTSSALYRSMLVQKGDNLFEALWKASFED